MWLYALELNERVNADRITADWEADHPTTPDTGVSQAGLDAVITSTNRVADYEDFADAVDYVESIEEFRELPDPATGDWDPPYAAHPNGSIEFVG